MHSHRLASLRRGDRLEHHIQTRSHRRRHRDRASYPVATIRRMTDTDDTITEIEIPDDLTKLTKPKLIELLQALTDAPEGIICLDGGPPNGTPVDVDGYAAPFLRWLDPEWSWEPMATTDAGSPFVGAHVDGTVLSLWGRVKAD